MIQDEHSQNLLKGESTLYQGTRFPEGTLRRKADLQRRIRPDPGDGRKRIRLHVKGDSMLPVLQTGDWVSIDLDSELDDAEVGQLATYIATVGPGQESYYTHQIIQIDRNQSTGSPELVMRGINNPRNDVQRVTTENFIGISGKL